MMSICVRYEKDEEMALEILNTAFMKVLKKLSTYQSKFPFDPWFKRITVNQAIDSYRKKPGGWSCLKTEWKIWRTKV